MTTLLNTATGKYPTSLLETTWLRMLDLGVVYLCRHKEGKAAVRRFLDSLCRFSAGAEYELHVIFKGFPDQYALNETRSLFGSIPLNAIEIDDEGYDIDAYLKAARQCSNRCLIFLNTFSEILAPDWLGHFSQAINQPNVGVVGATGSWQARTTGYEVRLVLILRWIASLFKGSSPTHLDPTAGSGEPRSATQEVLRYALAPATYIKDLLNYPRYPNPHIRTNAFMIRRGVFLSLSFPALGTKEGAYRFESGRRSMTNQIMARGLRPLIVAKGGKTCDVDQWQGSAVFWAGEQQNLLVSDNRTRAYAEGSPEIRTFLENMAWRHPRAWKHD